MAVNFGAVYLDEERANINLALELEQLDVNLFRSVRLWKPGPDSRAVFGGQIIGQSLCAAYETVHDPQLAVHSYHSYFVRPGDNEVPALYYVQCIRDGKSFATRQVTTKQHGKTIFEAMVSFHKPERSSLTYQDNMPDVPKPESLPTRQENWKSLLEAKGARMSHTMKDYVESRVMAPFPLDMRNCNPDIDGVVLRPKRQPRDPKMQVWVRAKQRLSDRPSLHACVAAYASDYHLITTAGLASSRMFAMAASLDHSMWFHADFRADEWMLYELESTRAIGGRALIHAKLFKQDGTLCVSISQEGLMRFPEEPAEAIAPRPKAKL
eukprot:TRINITY_DN111971_c0_g1_i1.p1 TRINITY_DN111971_c0_g1~~TRINITY_DN111971_c0_g1_i1.p1  ORF type:complete len:345 (-),score=47.41 TRINITY_DN111971_c0_g1_i1:244-1215(-)